MIIYLTIKDHPRSKPHSPGQAGLTQSAGPTLVGGPRNLKNRGISPALNTPLQNNKAGLNKMIFALTFLLPNESVVVNLYKPDYLGLTFIQDFKMCQG